MFFTEVQLSWEKHIPIMYSFWKPFYSIISYYKEILLKHIELNRLRRDKEHFTRWLFYGKKPSTNKGINGKYHSNRQWRSMVKVEQSEANFIQKFLP
jgi:hypothetical protein